MPPSGLRSMALRRQLLASFLVEYSSESGPAQLMVMPMPNSLAYEVVSLTISMDSLLVISPTTSSREPWISGGPVGDACPELRWLDSPLQPYRGYSMTIPRCRSRRLPVKKF